LLEGYYSHLTHYHALASAKYSYFLSFADKRVEGWLMMSSPMYTIYLCAAYLLFVAVGPKFMANRQPLQSRTLLILYNVAMVLLNLYIFVELLSTAILSNYNWVCTPVDYADEPLPNRMAAALWWYYFSKPIEFFDTVMFILRKKDRQVTFLHVYHHVTMPLLWWIGIKWVAGGQSFFGATLNSSVHVFMYSYYALSALGPHMQKHLWWKKHITHYQLFQFVWGIAHSVYSLYIDCPFPKWMQYACAGYAFSFLVLFSNFYIQNFLKKTGEKKEIKGAEANGKVNGTVKANAKANGKANGKLKAQ